MKTKDTRVPSLPIRTLHRPVVLHKAVLRLRVKDDRLRSRIISPLPLQVCYSSFTKFPAISGGVCAAVACVEVDAELGKTGVKERIILCRL